MTPQTGGSGAARQAFHFSSSESSLTLRSGRGECPQKPQEAGPDRSNVSAHLQHALLTPWSYPSPTRSPVLAIPDVVLRADSSSVSAPLGDSDQAGPALSASGQDLASSARDLESVGIAHLGPLTLISSLPVEVQETIASARAPATRMLYYSKWRVFESWCLAHAKDPVNCPVGPVLEFLQEKLAAGAAATTLKVYLATIAARRELDEIPLGWHQMVSAFMRGVRRL